MSGLSQYSMPITPMIDEQTLPYSTGSFRFPIVKTGYPKLFEATEEMYRPTRLSSLYWTTDSSFTFSTEKAIQKDLAEMQEQWLEDTASDIAFDVTKGKSWEESPKKIIKRALELALRNLPGYTYAERTDSSIPNQV